MWRLIKWLFFLAVLAIAFLAITGTKIGGKTIQEHFAPVFGSKLMKEGVRDIRMLVGEGFKAAGEAITEGVTDEERQQLDNLVKDELQKGAPIEGKAGQEALPPRIRPNVPIYERPRTVMPQPQQTQPPQQKGY